MPRSVLRHRPKRRAQALAVRAPRCTSRFRTHQRRTCAVRSTRCGRMLRAGEARSPGSLGGAANWSSG
eukprot:287959-Chlamydomonas_euryale.AAC.4